MTVFNSKIQKSSEKLKTLLHKKKMKKAEKREFSSWF